ncbi:MAG: glutathione S-transferase family protein [Alphaproteobacteria bacterium]
MSAENTVVVYGHPMSTYVRTVRMALMEKGVAYTFEPMPASRPEGTALHPFGAMPAFRHGDIHLFETLAITRYVDAAFPGAKLQPRDKRARAIMDQWVSAVSDYVYRDAIRSFVLQYVFPKGPGGTPDQKVIGEAMPRIRRDLAVLDRQLAENAYLAGAKLTLADLYLAPIASYIPAFPGGNDLMAPCPDLARWLEKMAKRPSFAATVPPRLSAKAS